MKIKYVLIATLLPLVAYGSFVAIRQMNLLKSSCMKVVGHKFSSLSVNYSMLILTLQVKNNSDIDLIIKNDNFNIYINDIYVSSVKTIHDAVLKAHSSANLDLRLEFDPKKVLSGLASTIASLMNDIKIRVKGSLTVVSSMIAINNLKIDETFELSDLLGPSDPNSPC